jgi:hypothetical protein
MKIFTAGLLLFFAVAFAVVFRRPLSAPKL